MCDLATLAGRLPTSSECSVTLAGGLPPSPESSIVLSGGLPTSPECPIVPAGGLPASPDTPATLEGRLPAFAPPDVQRTRPPKQQADGRPRQAHRQAHRYAADSGADRYRWSCRFICDHRIGSCLGRLKLYAPASADDFTTFRQVLWPLWTISQTGAWSPPALPAFSSLFALRMPQPAREATPRGSIHSRTGRKRQGREPGKSIFAPITN